MVRIKIDVHSHIIPNNILDLIRDQGHGFDTEIQNRSGQNWVVHKQGYQYPLLREFYDADQKLYDMESMGIDFTVLSPAPPMFMYWIDSNLAATFAREVNEGSSSFVESNPNQFLSFATIPLQDPKAAIKEIEYAFSLPGLCGVEIGTTIEGQTLDDLRFDDFFSLCEQLDWPIFLHPYYVGDKSGLSNYYLTNLIGNPLDTTLAAASLIFGKVLDNHPNLRILLAHGGGYLPYQIGRLDHGYEVRKESSTCAQKPSKYLNQFFYDSVTFEGQSLSYLIQTSGDTQVVLGTDYPFDMGENDPVGLLSTAIQHNDTLMNQITHNNACSFLGTAKIPK